MNFVGVAKQLSSSTARCNERRITDRDPTAFGCWKGYQFSCTQ